MIVNPIRVDDGFADSARSRLTEAGYAEPLRLETTKDDPGAAMSEKAVRAGVELVLYAGGDGTVWGVAGIGIPPGIVPPGTGNLVPIKRGTGGQVSSTLGACHGDYQ